LSRHNIVIGLVIGLIVLAQKVLVQLASIWIYIQNLVNDEDKNRTVAKVELKKPKTPH
jgi:hypothetical protein